MKLDAELMFECLIYLNIFYYPMFAICEASMAISKYYSIIDTPDIFQDNSICVSVLIVEIVKILLYRKFKDRKRDLITAVAVLFTMLTIAGNLYTFLIQCPVLKLEKILCTLMLMLGVTEVVFGILQILPCFKKVQYY